MRSKQKNISAKAYKILSLVLAFTVLVSGLGVWYISGTSNTVEAATQYKDIEYVGLDLYDYYYDNQILNGQINQGTQGGVNENPSAYSIFNSAVSDKFKNDFPTNYPLYFGGFWKVMGADQNDYASVYDNSLLAYIQGNSYQNFQWAVNLAQRGRLNSSSEQEDQTRYRASVQGLYDSSAPYFDKNFLNTQVTIKEIELVGITATKDSITPSWTNKGTSNIIQSGYCYDMYLNKSEEFWFNGEEHKSRTKNYQGVTTIKLHIQKDISSWTYKDFALLVKNSSGGNVNIPFRLVSTSSSEWTYELTLTDDQINTYGKNSKTSSIGAAYENLKFPFYHAGNGYYVFNSMSSDKIPSEISNNLKTIHSKSVYYDPTTKQIYKQGDKVNGTTVGTVNDSTGELGFFPFNLNTTNSDKLNYGFGARFTIDFQVSPDGKDANDNDIEFTFAGDDDVWVLLDGNLVLDLGGAHKNAVGKINFATKQATISTGVVTNPTGGVGQTIQNAGTVDVTNILGNSTATTQHTITVLYMERGMLNSNLFMSYNFTAIPNENTLTITDKVNAKDVNSGLQAQTLAIADSDVIHYTIKNQGTTNDDITDSGILYPTTDFIRRYNQISSTYKPSVLLSGQKTKYDTDYLYFTWSSDSTWGEASAVFGAWLCNTEGKASKLVRAEYDSSVEKYRVKTEGYKDMVLIRFAPDGQDKSFPDDTTKWPTKHFWNQTDDITDVQSNLTGNKYYLIGEYSSSTTKFPVSIVVDGTSSSQSSSIFTPGSISDDSDGFKKVSNTNFALSDGNNDLNGTLDSGLGLQIKDGETWTEYIGSVAGQTASDGTFNLMYGQSATFTGQFEKGSTMKVLQSNDLYKPTIRSDDTVTEFVLSGRLLDNYYTVSAPTLDNGNTVTADGTYTYQSASGVSDNEKVRLTETYVRSINTGNLTIIKNVAKGDTSEAGTFTFQVTLNNLFGSSGTSVSDYSKITYKLYANKNDTSYTKETLSAEGTFTMGPNQKVVIEGIPVGTTYTVTETNTGDNYQKLSVDINGTTVTDTNQVFTIGSNNTVTVTNERRTGSLTLEKDVKDSNGTDNVTNDDKNTEFTFTVTLTAPTGVDLSKYNIVGGTVSSDKKTITVNVSEKSPVTITGIPYGTGYTVTETEVTGWTQEQGSSTGTIGTISQSTQTATIVNKKNIVLTKDAYLTITKYIDSLYYNSSDNPHGFADTYSIISGISGNDTTNDAHGYLEYTNAEQVFTFKVEQCDSSTGNVVETYQVLLQFPANSTNTTAVTKDGTTYNYVQSKTFKVEAGYTYKVTETNTDNGLSWRYDFVEATGVLGSSNSTITNVNDSLTFTYAASAENAQRATATFYDKRNTKSNKIESDMSSITNNIAKSAA